MIKKTITQENALQRAADLCSRSEQCRQEIREKLNRWGLGSNDAEKIIARLVNERYIDDRRYARAYVADKFRFSGWGRRKIALMLRTKRIEAGFIEEALGRINKDEYADSALKLLKSRCRGHIPESREESARLIRFGMQRGFEADILIKALSRLRRLQEDNETD